VIAHPAIAFQPKGANPCGNRNTPEPIMLPITNATDMKKPSFRPGFSISTFTSSAGQKSRENLIPITRGFMSTS
jgi:hypothetical protein